MCLVTFKSVPNEAKQDITCYKLVYRNENKKIFFSALQNFRYKLGNQYNEHKFRTTNNPSSKNYGYIYYGFHAYKTVKEAALRGCATYSLLKCVIPEGTKYWEDKDSGTVCAQSLKAVAWKPMWNGKWSETF